MTPRTTKQSVVPTSTLRVNQPVRFGDVVALEIGRPLEATTTAAAFGAQPQATIGAAHAVTFTQALP